MAEYTYVKTPLYVKCGKFWKQYPMSYVELIDLNTGTVAGSGMQPDGDAATAFRCIEKNRNDEPCFTNFPQFDYDFYEQDECATKVLYEARPSR